jgi:hypothetical protein
VLVGKLLQLKQLDPNFVCPRCQGMDSDCGIVTFCPSCHARRDDTVLHACSTCHYDFRSGLARETLWHEAAPAEITGPIASATLAAQAAQAGWYPDPYGAPQLRWWDGYTWTEHTHETTTPIPVTDEGHRRVWRVTSDGVASEASVGLAG